MKRLLFCLLSTCVLHITVSAHRLDEYLQATTIAVEKDRVQAQIRLTPGVEVFRTVVATVDTNADTVISQFEQQAYAERLLRDLSLRIDGNRLRLRLVSSTFPSIEEMKEGPGNILSISTRKYLTATPTED